MSTDRLGFVLGLGMASVVVASATFWVGRRLEDPRHGVSADVAAFCADSVRSLPPSEGEFREVGCRVAMSSALESLATRHYADSLEQIRSLEALLRPITPVTPVTPPQIAVADHTGRDVTDPFRLGSEQSRDLMNPFESADPSTTAPPRHSTPAPMRLPKRKSPRAMEHTIRDPFNDASADSPQRERSPRAPDTGSPPRPQQGQDLMDPFSSAH